MQNHNIDFSALIEPVALELLGEPSSKRGNRWRWGTKGSFSADMQTATWFDHEAGEGGGLLALIERETGLAEPREQLNWLASRGYIDPLDATSEATSHHELVTKRQQRETEKAQRKANQEAQQQSEHAKAAERARWLWGNCKAPSADHPYLLLKDIDPDGLNLRQHPSGALVVPMYGPNGELVNLQFIDQDGKKRFLKDGRKEGCYTLIGADNGQGRVFVEGYATGYTSNQATGKQAIVAFDAGNLAPVTAAMAHDGDVVAADNDNAVKPGHRFGKRLSSYGSGHKAAMATGLPFYLSPIPGKDFNDLGTQATRAIFEAAPVSATPVFDAWKLAPAALKGTKADGWLNVLGKADTPESAARIARAIADRLSLTAPARATVAEVRQLIEMAAPARMIHPATLDNIAGRIDHIMQSYRKPDALKSVMLSSSAKAAHRVESVTALPVLAPADYQGVIVVRAPMAAGKTQKIGRPLATWATENSYRFIGICHRRSLVREMASRLTLEHYGDVDAGTAWAANGLATCLPSICRPDHAPLIDSARVVFIDEIAQTLDFMESSVCRTGQHNNRDVYERLSQIVADADCVVVTDAGVNDRVLHFLEQCRPGEQFRIIEMQAPTKAGIRATFASGQDDGAAHVIGECLEELTNDGRVWIACESKHRAAAIGSLIEQHDPALRVLTVHADNAGNKRQRDFMANPEAESLYYDVVIASPVISSGISIEHRDQEKPHFTLGAFIGNGNSITPADAAQMLRRVRYLTRFAIGLLPNTKVGQQHPDAILKAAETASRIEGKHSPATSFDALVADIRASHANAKADFAAALLWQLEAAGWELHRATAVDRAHIDALRQVQTDMRDHHREALKDTRILTDDEADALNRNSQRTELQSIMLEAHRLRRGLGLVGQSLTDEAIDFWDDGRAARQLDRFDAFRGIVPNHDDTSVPITQRRYLTACARAYGWLFDDIDTDAEGWLTPGVAELVLDRIMQHRHLLAHLGIVPRKFGKFMLTKSGDIVPMKRPEKATKVIGEVLALMGLETKGKQLRCHSTGVNTLGNYTATVTPSTAKKQKGNPRIRVYSITEGSYITMQAWADSRNAARKVVSVDTTPRRTQDGQAALVVEIRETVEPLRRAVRRSLVGLADNGEVVSRPLRPRRVREIAHA